MQGRLLVHAIPIFFAPSARILGYYSMMQNCHFCRFSAEGDVLLLLSGGAVLTNAFDDTALTAEPDSCLDFELYNRLCIILSSRLFLSWFSMFKNANLESLRFTVFTNCMILIRIIIVVYFFICMQNSFRNRISNVQKRQKFRLRRSEKHGFARANPARAEFQIRLNVCARSDRTHIGV